MRLATFDIFDTAVRRTCGTPQNVFFLIENGVFANETEAQLACIEAIPETKKRIHAWREKGYTIGFVSDMYLSSAFLKSILLREGLAEEQDKVFISCEHEATKAMGDLYETVRQAYEKEGNTITEWHHFGDNLNGDIRQAQKHGITAHYISSAERHIAGELIAPMYIAYVQWVLQACENQHITKIYFLSRDGYILWKIAETLQPKQALHYLFLSRKALQDTPKEKMLTYLAQEGLHDPTAKYAIVDLGWYGSTRQSLHNLLPDIDLHFFYFGVKADVLPNTAGAYSSFYQLGEFNTYFTPFVENYMSASPYPTTIGYAEKEGKIVPVFPTGEMYQRNAIIDANEYVCTELAQWTRGTAIDFRAWADQAKDKLMDMTMRADLSPLTNVAGIEGKPLAKRLTVWETLMSICLGHSYTSYDMASLKLSVPARLWPVLFRLALLTHKLRRKVYLLTLTAHEEHEGHEKNTTPCKRSVS